MKSVARKNERQKQEMEMFVKRKTKSRKTKSRKRQLLSEMDEEHEQAAMLGLCAVAIKKPRKIRDKNEARDTSWWKVGLLIGAMWQLKSTCN